METWLEYLLRFAHLVAGIAWIGSSFYFIWLDSSFEAPKTPKRNVDGETYMVHGGFYYLAEKRKIFPGELPKTLHWFKWEATLTWATGLILFMVLYFGRSASLLIDQSVRVLTPGQAIGLAVGVLVSTWFLYDVLWHPRFVVHQTYKTFAGILSIGLYTALVWGLCQIFSARGAYILTVAVLGNCMLLNVWVRILPGQAKMIQDATSGKVPD